MTPRRSTSRASVPSTPQPPPHPYPTHAPRSTQRRSRYPASTARYPRPHHLRPFRLRASGQGASTAVPVPTSIEAERAQTMRVTHAQSRLAGSRVRRTLLRGSPCKGRVLGVEWNWIPRAEVMSAQTRLRKRTRVSEAEVWMVEVLKVEGSKVEDSKVEGRKVKAPMFKVLKQLDFILTLSQTAIQQLNRLQKGRNLNSV